MESLIDLPVDSFMFSTEPITAVQQFFGLGYPMVFHILSLPGGVWGMPLALGLGRWLGGRAGAAAVLGAIALGASLKQSMTLAFTVPRPEGPDIVVYEDIELGSFPSGHTFVATVAWGMLWALGLTPVWIPVVIALAVSLGRMYLGVHYLADVVAGFVLAIPAVLLFRYLWRKLRPWLFRRSFTFWVWAGAVVMVGSVPPLLISPGNVRHWEMVGLAVGTVLALLIEYRRLPGAALESGWTRAPAIALGLAGGGLLIGLDWWVSGHAPLPLNTLMMALTCLWTLLAAPLVFSALGWSKPASASPGAAPPR